MACLVVQLQPLGRAIGCLGAPPRGVVEQQPVADPVQMDKSPVGSLPFLPPVSGLPRDPHPRYASRPAPVKHRRTLAPEEGMSQAVEAGAEWHEGTAVVRHFRPNAPAVLGRSGCAAAYFRP